MLGHLAQLEAPLRPHVKTTKSVDLVRHVFGDLSVPITVSTLKEAEYFADHGARDILYAVGIAENKMEHVHAIREAGVDLSIILDSRAAAEMVVARSTNANSQIPILIEVDADGHRAGVRPGSKELLEIGHILNAGPNTVLRGVLAHAGDSYNCRTPECIAEAAVRERELTLLSARFLRERGLSCPVVSIGSTPTALFSKNLTGVTEVRAGVFVTFDLVMAGIGVCHIHDIALSVLATVIGHQEEKGWVIVDAGWMAMSRDRGTALQAVDQGYGVVCDIHGNILDDVIMQAANQEHGIVTGRNGAPLSRSGYPIGTKVRILPNHACSTAAQFDHYLVIDREGKGAAKWTRIHGW